MPARFVNIEHDTPLCSRRICASGCLEGVRRARVWSRAGQQLLTDEGSDAFAESLRILVNEAMYAERSVALGARPFERTEARRGYANGFKPKTLKTRFGAITFDVPQVRGDLDFYPAALERGNQELKRRTRVASIFPNEASLLRLCSALLCEISDDWHSGKIYLDMNPSIPPSS